jgi:integrase
MSKTGSPWYRASHDAWYVWYGGRQVALAKGKESKGEAFARFAELLGDVPRPPEQPQGNFSSGHVVGAYLACAAASVESTTLSAYDCILRAFLKQFGGQAVARLRPEEVEAWAQSRSWSRTTCRYALTVVGGVFRWALREGLVTDNPLRSLRRPAGRSRGAEILIAPELHSRLLAVVSDEFRDFLQAVHGTGARPGEVARVEAKDVIWDVSCWVLAEHKTVRKTGRPRTVYLPPAVLAICRRLAERHPAGPLFRNTRGESWRKTGWKQAMARAQRKLGLTRRPMVSGHRHGFATDALAQGISDAQVAELLGHADTSMIHRLYGHLSA